MSVRVPKPVTDGTGRARAYTQPVPTSAAAQPLTMDDLSPAEQATAMLGIEPGQLRPLEHLNSAHYEQLKRQNKLDGTLMRRIEAHKVVSQKQTATTL